MSDADAGEHGGDAVVLTDILGQRVRLGKQTQRLLVFALVERQVTEVVHALDAAQWVVQLTADLQRCLQRFTRLGLLPMVTPDQADIVQAERESSDRHHRAPCAYPRLS